jgi:hypothetical protein
MLCPDCRSCQISSLSQRCGTDRSLQNGSASSVLAAYRSAVPAAHRVWLNVKYEERQTVKNMQARWCPDRKLWYVDSRWGEKHVARFAKWGAPVAVAAPIAAPIPVKQIPTTKEPVQGIASYDELMDAIRFGDSVSSAVKETVPAEKIELTDTLAASINATRR